MTANFDSIKPYQDFPYKPTDIIKSVYATDFNGDGLLDIIYDGNTGGTRNITQFFLNKGNGYKKVFSGYQSVIKTDFTNNKLTSFTLINAGGCGDPQIITYYYTVKYANNEPTFVLDKTIDYLNQTEKPKEMFASTKDFSITTDSSKLRSDCYVLDNTEHSVYGENGNAIATYKTGSKGKALGSKNDNGVEWIYVLMNVAPNIEGCSFQSFLDQPTEIKGWILKTDTDLK